MESIGAFEIICKTHTQKAKCERDKKTDRQTHKVKQNENKLAKQSKKKLKEKK